MKTANSQKQNLIRRFYEKLFHRQWTLGFFHGDIKEIIRSKSFDPNIKWLPIEPFTRFFADPFFFQKENGKYHLLAEEFNMVKEYGKISLITINEEFQMVEEKVLLDTESHFSYPFIFKENNKVYVFPESGKSGKLSCYEYDPKEKSLTFLKVIMDLPVMDPTILKYNNKYWLFGTLGGKDSRNKLFIYYSNDLLGPYTAHPRNPVKDTLKSSRPAGNFIEVDGILYRPSQNCENRYGESITINKINVLDEFNYNAEPHMAIVINKKNKCNQGIDSIHTINVYGNTIVVDGERRQFYPFSKVKHRMLKKIKSRRNYVAYLLSNSLLNFSMSDLII